MMNIDELFGSEKFKLGTDISKLHAAAELILKNPINLETFSHKEFLNSHTDIIVIERSLSKKMKKFWLGI
jgi:hypothetical protein